ncbi:HalOD1 output domain-containing protein [Natronolimnohabitans innermongolicus]|uniref:Halobacterial output domain-containing protein n=1 Tax=Natronolimnohabitans innermongolicus JCM 12255 TaxID=1227499 RepID=L9XNF6_9EURY|nr:HalOD1 output domain-containing protein [Natronolimnohabitans innermongolicus]ELY62178.1 hypothetical protein C493_00075 [Natronolimnohabitans innermongolicus JCM 12255]
MSASPDPSSPERSTVPTEAIVQAIADREGVDVTDVEPPAYEPLYSVVNPAALDRLFQTPRGSSPTVRVVLEYEGYEVAVDSDGRVEIDDEAVAGDSIGQAIEE